MSTRKRAASESAPAPIRAVRKEETRQKLLGAAHAQLAEQGFTSLSLREVTRQAGIAPAAFYRHFEDLDALGLALVEQCFRRLHDAMRGARARGPEGLSTATSREILLLLRLVRENRPHFRFIVRERFGGSTTIRAAIAGEMRAFENDLALDLAPDPALRTWSPEDLRLLAALLSTIMTRAVEETIESTEAAEHAAIESRVLRQLQMLGVGIRSWAT